MKLLVKILLFVFLVLAVNVNVTGAIITYSNIHQEKITPLSFDKEKTKSVFKDIEIDLSNCCKNGNDLVDYRNRGTGIEAVAAKGGVQYTKSSLKLGQEMHKAYKVGANGVKEFRGIKGIRPDFVDFSTKTIYELKPFNPRGIKRGTQQLNKYKSIFEKEYPGTVWKTVLDFY